MTLKTILATGCVVLTLAPWASAAQVGGTSTNPGTTQPVPSGGGTGDPSTHGTTDRAGQTPNPTGTGDTAATQGKGGTGGKATNGTSDKKGKRKPKHDKGDKGDKSVK